ncbi:hypothetical protein [Xanthomonas arboricola]|uniref:hypothetical protein n=1 Tax=Xanthomonas arboricola TaxID=56448 RepID=UPI001E40DC3C|nr:hypothetical protein [Xanthomonas arboricola]
MLQPSHAKARRPINQRRHDVNQNALHASKKNTYARRFNISSGGAATAGAVALEEHGASEPGPRAARCGVIGAAARR